MWVCPLLAGKILCVFLFGREAVSPRLRNVKPVVVSSGPQMGEKMISGLLSSLKLT